MSRVYRAKDSVLGRRVALKILTDTAAADPEAKARFLEEARLASSIAHENIIAVYDFGEEQGRPFMVMEFLEGESLRDAIQKHRTGDFARRMQIALQVGRALGHIHQKNIVHRDIKPENIRVDPAGRAKLMDFGIAKADGMPPTKAGFTVGTPYYMAPEQVMGEDVTIQADVYSFGVVMYELLTGKKPVEGETSEKIFHKVLYEPLNLEPLHEAAVVPAAIDLVSPCQWQGARRPASRARHRLRRHRRNFEAGCIAASSRACGAGGKPVSVDAELPEFLQAFPAPLRTQGGLALLAGIATIVVMTVVFFALRLARII